MKFFFSIHATVIIKRDFSIHLILTNNLTENMTAQIGKFLLSSHILSRLFLLQSVNIIWLTFNEYVILNKRKHHKCFYKLLRKGYQ